MPAVTPGPAFALHVARMPRLIGASVGVNDTVTGRPAAAVSCSAISGVCRCAPPTPYALIEPMTSLPSRCGLTDRPAPEAPDAATTTASGSTTPAVYAGTSASSDTVG